MILKCKTFLPENMTFLLWFFQWNIFDPKAVCFSAVGTAASFSQDLLFSMMSNTHCHLNKQTKP